MTEYLWERTTQQYERVDGDEVGKRCQSCRSYYTTGISDPGLICIICKGAQERLAEEKW